ncbi:arginine--tRNA ligase [bacterium]|nr:arginine--tRNA ligase [bacterium]
MNNSTALRTLLNHEVRSVLGLDESLEIQWTVPKRKDQGDLSTNIAMIEAKKRGTIPRDLASSIIESIDWGKLNVERAEVAGPGFVNIWIAPSYYHTIVDQILSEKGNYGQGEAVPDQKILVEFVSANPTGPLNVVSARAAAIGDSIVRILRKAGFEAVSEFYVNDAGRQVRRLGESVLARAKGEEVPEDGYHGEDVVSLAENLFPSGLNGSELAEVVGEQAAHLNVAHQKKVLDEYGVSFDRWFHESELHRDDTPKHTLEQLSAVGAVYEKDGATWFKGTEYGDVEDRVIITQEGRPTYLLPDIAYHLSKAERGATTAIDLLGPDHHDYVGRMHAALNALGKENFLEVIIVQQVHLLEGGEKVKMSKRAGKLVTLEELVEEVGKDVARYFFLQRRTSSHLDFDLDLAKEESERNPVFYVQYAHTRICGILRKEDCPDPYSADLSTLIELEEIELIKHLEQFAETIQRAAEAREPQRLASYLHDLATIFHKFYSAHRVIGVDAGLSAARAALSEASRIVLAEGLNLLGVSAPEKM